jgi:hypothetical protein
VYGIYELELSRLRTRQQIEPGAAPGSINPSWSCWGLCPQTPAPAAGLRTHRRDARVWHLRARTEHAPNPPVDRTRSCTWFDESIVDLLGALPKNPVPADLVVSHLQELDPPRSSSLVDERTPAHISWNEATQCVWEQQAPLALKTAYDVTH